MNDFLAEVEQRAYRLAIVATRNHDEQWFDPTLLIDEELFDENLEKGQNDEDD